MNKKELCTILYKIGIFTESQKNNHLNTAITQHEVIHHAQVIFQFTQEQNDFLCKENIKLRKRLEDLTQITFNFLENRV